MSKYGGNNRIDFGVHFNTDKSSLEQVKKSLQEIQNIKPAQFKGTEQELRSIQKTAKLVETAIQKAFSVKLNAVNADQFKANLKEAGYTIDSVYNKLAQLGTQGKTAFNQMATSITTTNVQLRQSQGILASMAETMVNTAKWGVASRAINGVTESVREAFQYVKSLDSALTDIRIVTGDSTEQMAKFADQANKAAQALGRSTMDYSKAALTFYQQGLSDEDVAARTEATLKAQNITGAGLEMADYLTAVWNGYKVANEEAELYVDKLAAVADSSASNMSLLAVAMSKVASTANLLGVPVDSLNAQIATIVATTRQAPLTVGNALKTIYARINDIKTGSDEAEVSLGNYTSQMAQLGINVLDASGNLRDTGDVIEEIGGKWENLSREQQIYLARTMAGQRQYNNLLALFENWGKYTDLVNISMDAQGTTMEKNSRYMDSLAAHMEQLGAAGLRVKSAMIDSDSFKGLIDIGTGLTNLFANFVESIGGGGAAITTLTGILLANPIFNGILSRLIGNTILKAREGKAVIQDMQNAIQNTSNLMNSDAYAAGGPFKDYIDNLGQVHASWQVLSQDERQEQERRAERILSNAEEVAGLEKSIAAAQNFANALHKNINLEKGTGITLLKPRLEEVSTALEIASNEFQNFGIVYENTLEKPEEAKKAYTDLKFALLELYNSTGQSLEGFDKINNILLQGISTGKLSQQQYDQLELSISQFLNIGQSSINNVLGFDQMVSKGQLLKQVLNEDLVAFGRMNLRAQTLSKVQGFTQLTSGAAMLASSIQSIVNITKIWNNENLSTGEKFLQILTSSLFSIGMVASSLKQIKASFSSLYGPAIALEQAEKRRANAAALNVLAKKQLVLEEQKLLMTEKVKELKSKGEAITAFLRVQLQQLEKSLFGINTELDTTNAKVALLGDLSLKEKLTISFKQMEKGLFDAGTALKGFFTSIPGYITIGVAAVVALTAAVYAYYTKEERAAKKARELADKLKTNYSEIQKLVNNVNSSFDQLKNAQTNLKGLTNGTNLWKSALADVNSQVLELCKTFPQLNKYLYTTSEGMLDFQDGAEEEIKQAINSASLGNALAYIHAEQTATLAENNSLITNASRKDINVSDVIGLNKVKLLNLLEAMLKQGNSVLDNTLELGKLGFTGNEINRIQGQLKDKIILLRTEVTGNSNATKNLTNAILKSELEGTPLYENAKDKDAFVSLVDVSQQKQADDLLSSFRYYNGSSIDYNYDQIKKYLAEYFGIDEHAISVSTFGGNLKFTKGDQQYNYKPEEAAKIAAEQKAASDHFLQNVKNANEIMLDLANKFKEDKFGAETGAYELAKNADKIRLGDYSDIDVSKFSQLSIKSIREKSKAVGDSLNVEKENIEGALDSISESIVVGLEDYKSTLSQSTQRVFEELHVVDSGRYSKEAATVLGNILESALGDPKQYDFLKDVLKDVSPEDLPSLENLINTTDWETTSISEFQDALKEAGVLLNLTDDLLITFINTIKELKGLLSSPLAKYAKIHLITDGLKRGDSITPEQQADLLAAGISLDGFFQKGKDGLLHLTTSAELFQKYVDQISLKNFEDEVNSLQLQIAQIQNFQSSEYGHIEGDTRTVADQNTERWNRFSQNSYDTGIIGLDSAQVQFLQNQVELTEEEKKLVDDINNLKEHGKSLTAEQAEELSKIVQLHLKEWLNSSESLNGLKERLDEINGELSEGALDPDVDIELHAQLTEYLEQNAKYIEDFSDSLEEDKEAALEIAESILRMDSALLSLQENSELWERALSGSAEDMARVAPELRNAYADMFDINGAEALSNEFITSADNLRLMELAANGSTAAMDLLDQRITADLTAHPRMDLGEFNTSQDLLLNMISNINSQMNDIEVGARINDVGLLNDINDVLATCAQTRDQAEAILSDMRVDGEVEQITVPKESVTQANDVIADPTSTTEQIPIILPDGTVEYQDVNIPSFRYKVQPSESSTAKSSDMVTVWALKPGHNPTKAASPKLNYKHSTHGGGGKTSGSGKKGGGGGKGSSAKPSIAKTNTTKIDTKKKTQENDPYYKINNSIEKQSKLLDDIKDQEKQLVNKDRLKNLQSQNKEIEKQLGNYQEYLSISKNVAAENSTANLRKRLQDAFGSNIGFDAEGNIADMNKVLRAAVDSYNKAATQAENTFKKVQDQYNNWILHTWNTYSKDQQEAHQKDKEAWDEKIKNAETAAKDAISAAEEEYKKKTDLIKKYQDQLKKDKEMHEKYIELLRQIIENNLEASKIKVDLALDTGLLERDWLEFENKFIKKLDDKDILGQAAANAKELMSYFDSEEIAKTNKLIEDLYKDLNNIQNGGFSNIYGVDEEYYNGLTEAEKESLRTWGEGLLQKRLQELQEQQQESLMKMQDLMNENKELYLDMLDQAKDSMDDHIDQYERINDIIEHNIKLTEMLYGDKGYLTLNKYYQMQKDNNMSTLLTLKAQEAYWREQFNNTRYEDDPLAWKKFKENLEDAIDAVNSKLEDMLDNLAKEFENKMNAAVDRINNRLTSGLGTNYLDEQWDYLNNYDDYFLDTYNATTGIEDVTRAYQQAIDDAAANPKQQQKLNKLMNDQLKILKEKDKLTEYDLERAKSMLEVEKARMALEDARNNKTKMRLRRDSQGNYTYQYVADELKLGELQQALADAQNDLYNTDKEHYKENLNTLYDTYKEYIEKMKDLTAEYNATQDEEERKRIQNRMDLLKESYSKMYEGLTEDNKYNIQYLAESFSTGMNLDFSGLTTEEQWEVLKENVPWAQSNIQALADSIVAEGGLLPATKDLVKELGDAIVQYDTDVQHILETGGTSLATISGVLDENGMPLDLNITDTQKMVEYNNLLVNATMQGVEEMQTLLSTVDEYWNKQMENIQKYVTTLQNSYDTLQKLNDSTLTSDKIDVVDTQTSSTTDAVSDLAFTGDLKSDTNMLQEKLNSLMLEYKEFLASMGAAVFDTGGYTGIWGGDDGKIALLHQKELVLNPTDTENILAAVTAVRDATASMNITSLLDNLGNSTSNLLRNLLENSTLLDQNVHIDANFPNVNNHTLIEEAFNNLVNMAAMRASGYRD